MEWTTLEGCLTAGISVKKNYNKNYFKKRKGGKNVKYVCLSNILIGKMEVFTFFYLKNNNPVDASSAGVGLWNHCRERTNKQTTTTKPERKKEKRKKERKNNGS